MWYWINLKFKCKDTSNPEFFIALMVLDQLLAPVVKKFRKDFEFWRFHWSSTNDDGHRLKFFFRTSSQVAEKVTKFVNNLNLCSFAKSEYIEIPEIRHEVFSDNIEAISDENWPDELKKSFPNYIMGVCDMALSLIEEIKKKQNQGVNQNNKTQLEEVYKKIEKELASVWKRYGNHAFLHHLALILGNKKIVIGTTGVLSELRSGDNKISGLILKIDNQIFPNLS